MTDTERQDAIETLGRLIRDIPVAMLTTSLADRSLRSRPMVNVNHTFNGDLWFFTPQDDPKVHEIVGNPQVNVSFASPAKGRYVSVTGQAFVTRDMKRAELLWTEDCKKWFPAGLSDSLSLVKVDVEQAEYWDEQSGVMVTLVGLLSRVVTGTRPHRAEHETIDWRRVSEFPGKHSSPQ